MSVTVNEDNTEQWGRDFNSALLKGLEAVGLMAEGYAKEELSKPKPHKSGPPRPNVDTGRLRDSVTHAIDNGEKAAYVGTNVEYGPYIELGTSTSGPFPFLVPAAQNHGDQYRQLIEDALKGE